VSAEALSSVLQVAPLGGGLAGAAVGMQAGVVVVDVVVVVVVVVVVLGIGLVG
jgi:hypothetical protein